MHKVYKIVVMLSLVSFGGLRGQEKEKDLGTETVTVTKAYSPTISDAFKLKSIPELNDSIVLQKKKIEYSIFSVPVASTFAPAKGKASTVKKSPPPATVQLLCFCRWGKSCQFNGQVLYEQGHR